MPPCQCPGPAGLHPMRCGRTAGRPSDEGRWAGRHRAVLCCGQTFRRGVHCSGARLGALIYLSSKGTRDCVTGSSTTAWRAATEYKLLLQVSLSLVQPARKVRQLLQHHRLSPGRPLLHCCNFLLNFLRRRGRRDSLGA